MIDNKNEWGEWPKYYHGLILKNKNWSYFARWYRQTCKPQASVKPCEFNVLETMFCDECWTSLKNVFNLSFPSCRTPFIRRKCEHMLAADEERYKLFLRERQKGVAYFTTEALDCFADISLLSESSEPIESRAYQHLKCLPLQIWTLFPSYFLLKNMYLLKINW